MIKNIDLNDAEQVTKQIEIAQQWALEHFNAKNCHNTKLVDDEMIFMKPSFFVEFPTIDTMLVAPSIMGKKHWIEFEYKLAFNPLEWHGKHPFFGTPMPPLKVK